MDMLRRNLKRQASRSLSAFSGAASPRAVDQENLHPNLASSPPASPAKGTASLRPKHPAAVAVAVAVAPPTATAEEDRTAVAPPDNEPSGGGAGAANGKPAGGRQRSMVRPQDRPRVCCCRRPVLVVDGVLDDTASQADAFDLVGIPMIENALAGFNSSLVCYGQSGTGKTYTMRQPLGTMVDSGSDHADPGLEKRRRFSPPLHQLEAGRSRKRSCNSVHMSLGDDEPQEI